jgi:glycosyltransferase involved in cell wall biosynthesis
MVVLLVNKFFYDRGGSERYFFMQSEELSARGHDVVHFSMHHPDNRTSPWSRFFVSERDYARGSVLGAKEFVRSSEAARNLERLIAEIRPDVAHLHNIYHQITPSIIPVLVRHGIPVVITLHDYKLVCPSYRMFAHGEYCDRCLGGRYHHAALMRCHEHSFARSALLAVEAYCQRRSRVYDDIDVLFAPSRYMRDTFVRAGFDAERVRYLPSFLPAADPGGGEDGAGPSLPDDYLLYFGRLSDEKGLGTLMRAAVNRRDIPVVLAGDGPERARLEAIAARHDLRNVYFTGYLDKSVIDGVVRRAQAVVLPALWPENAPFTVLETAVQGVPVIVSDMGGLPEMAEVVGGTVFTHGEVESLLGAIDAVWADPAAARERARAGRERAVAHYDKTRHMDTLEAVYGELTAGARS